MKKFLFWIIIIAILVIAAFTNPKREAHQEAVKDKVTSLIREEVDNKNSNVGGLIASVLGDPIANAVVKKVITSDNYVFFSLTKFNFAGKEKVIGIGLFGNVFISNKLKELPKEELDKLIR